MAQRVLVTNDDGIDGEGLRVLVGVLEDHGYDLLVVAPNRDYSGAGTSLLGDQGVMQAPDGGEPPRREIAYEARTLPEAPNAEAYALATAPAMCTLMTMRGAFGPRPDIVVSGINFGCNTGPAIRHSGTVSAAITAGSFDVPAIAVSSEFVFTDPTKPLRYDTAAELAVQLMKVFPATEHRVVSLNVPCCDLDELAGVRAAPVATASGFESFVEERTDGKLLLSYRIVDNVIDAESDSALIKAGFATVSSLLGPSAIDCRDLILRLEDEAA